MGIRLDDLLAQSEAPVASVQPTGGIRLDDLLVQPDQPVSAASPDGLSAGIAGLRARSNPEEWRDRANNEIRRIETGVDLTKTDAGDGTFSYQEQRVRPPRSLSNSEKIAILDAHRQQYSVFDQQTPETGQRMATQEEAYRQDQLRRQYEGQGFVRNAANAGLNAVLSLGPNITKLIDPNAAGSSSGLTLAQGQEAVSDVLAADPESWGTTTGNVVGGTTPFILGPAGLAAGAAGGAGQFREQVQQARQQGVDIPVINELLGVGLIAANTLLMGKFRPAGANVTLSNLANNAVFKSKVANAVTQYALHAGLAASDMTILQTVDNVIKQAAANPEQSLTEGVGEAGFVGGLAGAVTHAPGLVRGIRGAKSGVPVANPTAEPPVGPYERAFQDRLLSEAEKPGTRISGRPEPSPFPVKEGEYTMEAATETMRKGDTDIEAVMRMRAGGERKPARATDILTPSPAEKTPTLAESEANLRSMYEKFTAAKEQSQAETILPEAERLAQGKFADHAAAEFQEGLEKVSAAHGEDVAEDMLARIQQQPAGVPSVETQSQVTNEPIRKNVGNLADPGTKVEWTDAQGNARKGVYEGRAVDGGHWVIAGEQRSKVADVTIAADQGKPSLEQRAKPVIPDEARDWSYTKLKGWAKANGYDISKADNIRSLRLRVAEQRGDSLTDLPQRPSKSELWGARRLRYWAEANGYTIPGEARTPLDIRKSLDAQRGESIAYGKEALRQINKGPGERKALKGVQPPDVPQNAPAETPEQRTVREETVKASIAKALREKPNELRAVTSQIPGALGKMFAPMWARIEDISSAIYGRLRRREYDTGIATESAQRESLPLMEQLTTALGGRDSAKYKEASRLLQSQQFDAAKALLPESARAAVDQLSAIRRRVFEEARANGVNAGDIGPEHWPRFVKDLATLKASVGTEELGQIEAAWKQAELNRGGPLQTAEKMEIANKVTTGYGPKKPGAVGPPSARERRIGELTPDQVPLYQDFLSSHTKYLEQMITAGERAKFLGKSDDPSMLKESIGKIVYDEITAGRMKPEHQAEMTGLLQTLLTGESARASKGVRVATQLIHLATLGQLRTAWNQVIDASFAAGKHGFKSAAAGMKAALGFSPAEHKVAMREVGLNDRGTEFREVGKLAKAVGWVMKLSGLSRFDRFSKELVMNAAHDRYQKLASNPTGTEYGRFERKYKPMLGETEFNKTVADYRSGEKTARTGFVEFVEVGEVQPTSLMSMPEAYIKNPNLRILYTLRSFQISQLSFVVRNGLRKLASKVPGERTEGIKTLARFTTTMLIANVGKDLLYKFLHGEDVKPEDLPLAAVNSILGLVGLSTYALKTAASDPVAAALRFVSPPVGFVTDVWKDVTGQSWGKGSKTVRYIPLAGDALYYWAPFGHGYHARKEVAKADFNASLMDMRRRAYTAYSGGDPGTARAWMDKYNSLLPAGKKKMVFSDVQYPPRDTSERKTARGLKEQAIVAMRTGDTGKARTLLNEYNRGRRSGRLDIGDLRESVAQEEE